jgi:RNA polymerase sigma-70 factor (ECF subfamily)
LSPSLDPDIDELLARSSAGDTHAGETLFKLLYQELHGIAGALMRQQPKGHTLQPTALVHEAYVKLMKAPGGTQLTRSHFLRASARAMRSVLIDHARRRKHKPKRFEGAGLPDSHLLDQVVCAWEGRALDLLALDEALERLEAKDARMARLVELRFFAGLSLSEAADVLDMSLGQLEREWAVARRWLRKELP